MSLSVIRDINAVLRFYRSRGNIRWHIFTHHEIAVKIFVQTDDVKASIHLAAELVCQAVAVFECIARSGQFLDHFGMVAIGIGEFIFHFCP